MLAWLALSLAIAAWIFVHSEREVDIASHEAVISPNLSGEVVLDTGPVLPDFRASSGSWVGMDIVLGKTEATSMQELTARYATIASQPDGQVAVAVRALKTMAYAALVQGLVLGALPFLLVVLVGKERWRSLLHNVRSRRGAVAVVVVGAMVALIVVPYGWGRNEPEERAWVSLGEYVGPDVDLPPEAKGVEIQSNVMAGETKRLIGSALDSYRQGLDFYRKAADDAADLALRTPDDDEVVVLLVSDRHLNVGMDKVARAIADRAKATAVFDAGDDTSTGARWEAFSLDSVSTAFEDLDRWAVAGNHDNGSFVRQHMEDLGWTYFDGEVLDGPDGGRILGVDDPRSSGLGNWRDEKGLSSRDVADRLTEAVCDADADGDRVNTLLVHDADFGDQALERGCVDLVIGGHTHVTSGPTAVIGDNDVVGYTFTVGTAGGAAYAIAIGSKLRRAADVALLTYRDGRPIGIQDVMLQTNGRFHVGEWTELTYEAGADDVGTGAGTGGGATPGPRR